MTKEEKMKQISLLLASALSDPFIRQFFDADSEEMLDEKIEVLTAVKEGKAPKDIPNYYKVMELFPPDGQDWDL